MEYPKLILMNDEKSTNTLNINDVFLFPDLRGEIKISDYCSIQIMAKGEFEQRALYLPDRYDYVLGMDQEGRRMLVVIKKDQWEGR